MAADAFFCGEPRHSIGSPFDCLVARVCACDAAPAASDALGAVEGRVYDAVTVKFIRAHEVYQGSADEFLDRGHYAVCHV